MTNFNDVDPLKLVKFLWPKVRLYKQQQEIIYSIWENDETFVPAGNMLGKDYIAGLAMVIFFLTRYPCRVVTTSAKDDHLRVVWGEAKKFIQTAAYPLDVKDGGCLIVNDRELKRVVNGRVCPISYAIGMVASDQTIAAMQGHHVPNVGDGIPRTLGILDESSSVDEEYFKMMRTWTNRLLSIGNTWPCNNSFRWALKGKPGTDDQGGDIKRDSGGFHRKVIRIKATDSPNVRVGLEEVRRGLKPSDRMVVPGVKSYGEYTKNLKLWDVIQQTVSLEAEFYDGKEVKLFPEDWLNLAKKVALKVMMSGIKRQAESIGIDPGEGVSASSMTAVDRFGVIDTESPLTPDTTDVTENAIRFGEKHRVDPKHWWFDRGGGGKQHADRLRKDGYKVMTVGFGESLTPDPVGFRFPVKTRKSDKELQYAYKLRRDQMYGALSQLLDPSINPQGFAIPARFAEFFRQLAVIPKRYDGEGRLRIPSKNKRTENSNEVTLTELIGKSPDEADSLVLAVYGMQYRDMRPKAGAL